MKIGCVILAGGKSSRMGSDKALLKIKNETFIEHLMEELSGFGEKLIARGDNGGVFSTDWTVLPDIYKEHGPLGGLHSALSVCSSDALFCVTCDMPLLQKGFCKEVCDEWEDAYDAVIVETADGRKHPLCGIYRKEAAKVLEMQMKSGDNRVMRALEKMRVKVVKVDSDKTAHQLKNVNTPEDYLEIREM